MSGERAARPDGVELIVALPTCQQDPDFPSAERQRAYAAHLETLGARTVLWTYEPEGEPALTALRARVGFRVLPLIPNMPAYMRNAADHGVVGAARRRFQRLGLRDQLRIALHHAARAPRVLARDFATGLLILVEMELARFRRHAPAGVMLSASVTDLALALGRAELLRDFVRLAERRYGLEAGLATHNYGTLAARLGEWDIRPGVIAAPFNPRGYLMNPSRLACEAANRAGAAPVLATHLEVDGLVSRPAALDYVRSLGIRRAVVEARP